METTTLVTLSPIELKQLVASAVREELSSILGNRSNSPSKETYLSRKEAANLLGVSLPTLYSWVKSGQLKAHRIGNSIRFKSSEIDLSLKKIKHV